MKVQRVLEYDCFICDGCRNYIYDEAAGEPARAIEPRTRVDELPRNWTCPLCGKDRTSLRASTLVDEFWLEPLNRLESSSIDCEAHRRYGANQSKKHVTFNNQLY